jgi:hypothetical protein
LSQTRWNKTQTITNSDAYNLAGDEATQADTSNVVVPVASSTERDALTPPAGKYAGMAVARTDLPGVPIQTRDASGNWSLLNGLPILASSPHVGSGSGLLANLQGGTARAFIQTGSQTITPDSNGYFSITLPVAYPNGLLSAWAISGDNNVSSGSSLLFSLGSASPTTSQLNFRVWSTSANAPATTLLRIDWAAIGW